MKKLFTLITSLLFTITACCQAQLINNGFESWTNGIPDGWSTTKTLVPSSSLETQDTTDQYAGHSCIKIVTGHAGSPIDTLSGFVHYGANISYSAGVGLNYNESTPFLCEPDSIRFAYKYTSVGGDQGGFYCYFDTNSNPGFSYYFIDGSPLTPTATWQTVTSGFFGGKTGTDSVSLTFFSGYSQLSNPVFHAGSTLWLDSITFIYNNSSGNCVTGVNEVGANLPLRVYPNPADGQVALTVMSSEMGSQVQVIDRIGREVYAATLDQPN